MAYQATPYVNRLCRELAEKDTEIERLRALLRECRPLVESAEGTWTDISTRRNLLARLDECLHSA